MKKTILIIIFAIAIVNVSWADRIKIYDRDTNGSINLTTSQIVYDEKEPLLVAKTAHLLSEDIGKVCGHNSAVGTKIADKQVVILGTLDNSKIISNLVKKKKLDVSPIEKGWERYIVKTIDNPMRGVEKALVIVGSDRRGVAYGAFEISEAIGVSPFYWWADIPVKHKEKIFIEADVVSDAPTIRYRGLFINDEDWGLKPWSSRNFEKELGDIGPKTYAKVCELILRMKGNMLAPAMHTCSGAFYSHPESKLVADTFGIIITTSHCEPLLLNNASKFDWDQKIDGDWDYGKNPQGILKRWKNRLGEASQFENLYTMAMRGLHDAGLRGNYTMDERVVLLEKVIKDQRDLLRNYTNKPVTEIPQIFVPYKETMDVYEHGLNVPDDITLVWVDDNYGYMKRVSSPEEQKRSGRAGVYYHTSYLGGPHDYLWLNTTPPTLMYEELKKSYDTGADRYWLLNVGDIKPAELALTTFFHMAWKLDDVNYENVNHLQADWLKGVFGVDCQSLLDEHYRLAWSRKPEFMGWEREWDKKELADILDTEFSFENYNDAQQRLADYQAISDKAYAMMQSLPLEYQPAFYELVAFPIMGAYQMNRKFLMAQLNHELYKKGKTAEANWAADEATIAYDSLQTLMYQYNHQLDGKWNHMMALAPGWCAKYQNMPKLNVTEGVHPKECKDALVNSEKSALEGCAVLNLADYKHKSADEIRLLNGVGYDWQCVQLGEPTTKAFQPQDPEAPYIDYEFSFDKYCPDTVKAAGERGQTSSHDLPSGSRLDEAKSKEIEVTVYSLPFFPIYKGRSTRYGVSVDNSAPQIAECLPKEYGEEWKDNVLRNGAVFKGKYIVDLTEKTHKLRLSLIDPGMIIERIIIDWGGLKASYIGPSAPDSKITR